MYTECPECRTAFRLTANTLRQAQGRVRCGGCGSTFNALDHLSETMPDDDPSNTQTARLFDQQSRALLDSLGEISGRENVRIEDTGVEWRVLDVDGASNSEAENADDSDATGINDRDDVDDGGSTGTINWVLEDPDETDGDTIAARLDDDHGNGADDAAAAPSGAADSRDTKPGADESGGQAALDLPSTEMRFDDHTPLPDDFYRPSEQPGFSPAGDTDQDATVTPTLEPPPLQDGRGTAAAADDAAGALEADSSDNGDWEDLLSEVELDEADDPAAAAEARHAVTPGPPSAAADSATAPGVDCDSDSGSERDREDELEILDADTDNEPAAGYDKTIAGAVSDDTGAAPEEAFAADAGDDAAAKRSSGGFGDETAEDGNAGAMDGAAGNAPGDDDALARSVEMEIDQELMRAAAETGALTTMAASDTGGTGASDQYHPDDDEDTDSTLVESIVMEGDTVTDLLLDAEPATLDSDPLEPASGGNRADEQSDTRRRYGMIGAVVVLAVALAAQLVHANRESLATLDGFDSSIGTLYRAFGAPVTPSWDISGWQFESTTGSTDESDQRLIIRSRISNASDTNLPYPLVHLSLTDRFEEVVGSRILAPREYLAGTGEPGRPVRPGNGFTAIIAVDAPSPDATGFKLNVCYSMTGGSLRCAIEDFRN